MRRGVSPARGGDEDRGDRRRRGFGLLEVLLALAVGGLLLASLTELIGRTLSRWTDGFFTLSQIERVDLALDRLGRDLAGLVPAPGVTGDATTLMIGDASGLRFTAAVPVSPTETATAVVEWRSEPGASGAALTRRWRRSGGAAVEGGGVALGGPLDVAFAYVDRLGRRSAAWNRPGQVPVGVVVALRGSAAAGGLPSEIFVPIPVRLSVSCLTGRVLERGGPRRRDADAMRSTIFEQSTDKSIAFEDVEVVDRPPHCTVPGAETEPPPKPAAGGEAGARR